MRGMFAILLAGSISSIALRGQDRDARIDDLEKKLSEARNSVAALQKTIEGLIIAAFFTNRSGVWRVFCCQKYVMIFLT